MSRFHFFVISVLTLLTAGVVALSIFQFKSHQILESLKKSNTVATIPTNATASAELAETIASQSASLVDLLARVENLENDQTQPTAKTTPSSTAAFQKQVIYLGAASSSSREWTNSGLEVVLDSADYPANVVATFEAGLSIVGGEAWARLANKTTGAILSASEVSHGSNTTTWKTSAAFKLHPGKNTYVVQIRSTSGEVANLAGARITINQ